ncbi:hypothetical protein [uncultured Arcticibacterium sp.]|mgnify:CR=1 FL=1|uniref:hypothetical protein n=1 Tax=uncultured Arcticibacterium sp. TaxID=2173042 RepID=UPI0030F976F6
MINFIKEALEGIYILYNDPNKSESEVKGNIKFVFPLPMFFLFGGLGIHIMLDIPLINGLITGSKKLVFVSGVIFNSLAYPVCFRYFIPLLKPDEIDMSKKNRKIWTFIFYFFGCFILMTILAWLTNYTRADEFRQ